MSDVVGYRVAMQEERGAELRSRIQQLLAPLLRTERALDSGCGAGALAFALAPFVESVVGVDLSVDLVAAGNEIAPANCELRVGDATALPFEYGSFDIAGCMRVLHHTRRPELVVSELARVTRPGGRLAVFHPVGRVTLAARHGGVPSDDDVVAPERLALLCAATGWNLEWIDDAEERYLALATRQ